MPQLTLVSQRLPHSDEGLLDAYSHAVTSAVVPTSWWLRAGCW